MKSGYSAMTLAVALILAGCGDGESNLNQAAANQSAPLPQIPAPDNGDWTQVVEVTPDGGYRMGNPDAPVKLVEYASMTCPACAAFAEEGAEPLTETYVRSGQVSWEFRNFLLGGPDLAISLLSRCQPPTAFFRTVDQAFQRQREFLGNIDDAEAQRIGALPPEQQVLPLARAMELDTFFARRGMPEARFEACLTDRAEIERLTAMRERGTELGVPGTPSFFINGERIEATQWPGLEPRLRAAIGS